MAAPSPSAFPLWAGDTNFALLLDAVIGHPHLHPERYDSKALPVRRLAAVYGSPGAQKRRILEAYCFSIDCPKLVISVRNALPATLEEARNELDRYLQPKKSPYGVDAVIIVNHAQHMQRDPHALSWAAKAEEANVVIVALFDEIPTGNPEFRGLFHKATLYLSPPDTSALRVAQMRWHLDHYANKCGAGAVQCQISDDEWTQIGDQYTARASPRQLKHYVQALLYHVLQTGEPLTYALATRAPFVTSAGGEGPHIVPRALNTEENALAAAAGAGPVHFVPPIPVPSNRSVKKKRRVEAPELPPPPPPSLLDEPTEEIKAE
jgi:hypothetical protein